MDTFPPPTMCVLQTHACWIHLCTAGKIYIFQNSMTIRSINLTEKVGTVDIFLNYSLDFSDLKLASVILIRVGECPLHGGNVQHTCKRLKRRTLRSGTYSVYGISLLIAMNTQLVMITSMTNRLKNVNGTRQGQRWRADASQ